MTPPKGDGVPLLYTSIALLVLSWFTFFTRSGVRISRQAFGLDDWLMFSGLLVFTVTCSLCIICSFYGSGQKSAVLKASDIAKGTELFFIAEFFYAFGAVLIKCSIAVTLLRIADCRRRFVASIWIIMIVQALSAVVFIVTIANICHPIDKLWHTSLAGECNLKLNSDISLFFSAIEITTDWALAILPGILLWNVQMKGSVKMSVALILGLAAFASCATIVRLRFLSLYSDPTEFMYSTGKIGLWSVIEEGIGIFAGSLPALRPLLSLSFLHLDPGTDDSGQKISGAKFNKPRTRRDRSKMLPTDLALDTFQQLDDESGHVQSEEHGDGESQKHILKETQVSVTNDQRSGTPGEWERSQVLGWNKSGFNTN